jgi:hypothetical protein
LVLTNEQYALEVVLYFINKLLTLKAPAIDFKVFGCEPKGRGFIPSGTPLDIQITA